MKLVSLDTEIYRLIPSRFPPVQVYEGLVANDRLEAVAEAESRTNPRLLASDRLQLAGTPATANRLQNFNHAPFKYINPEGTLFFPPLRPALEAADDPQTALAVAVARREKFLKRTAEPAIGLDMRMLKTPVQGIFADLCHVPSDLPADERFEMAASLPTDITGIVYLCPERPSHQCLAVLDGEALGYTLQTAHFRFWWDGERISTVYAFNDARKFDAAQLAEALDLLAA